MPRSSLPLSIMPSAKNNLSSKLDKRKATFGSVGFACAENKGPGASQAASTTQKERTKLPPGLRSNIFTLSPTVKLRLSVAKKRDKINPPDMVVRPDPTPDIASLRIP